MSKRRGHFFIEKNNIYWRKAHKNKIYLLLISHIKQFQKGRNQKFSDKSSNLYKFKNRVIFEQSKNSHISHKILLNLTCARCLRGDRCAWACSRRRPSRSWRSGSQRWCNAPGRKTRTDFVQRPAAANIVHRWHLFFFKKNFFVGNIGVPFLSFVDCSKMTLFLNL